MPHRRAAEQKEVTAEHARDQRGTPSAIALRRLAASAETAAAASDTYAAPNRRTNARNRRYNTGESIPA